MCNEQEIEEMIVAFRDLPDLYQRSVIAVVKDRTDLFSFQRSEICRMAFLDDFYNLAQKSAISSTS